MADFKFKNFEKVSKLSLNGTTTSENGESEKVLRLTNDNSSPQWGSAFYFKPIDISKNTSFESYFQFQMSGGSESAYPTGLTFMLQNDSRKDNALGGSVGEIGYGGISSSVAVEYDTWASGYNEPRNSHIGIDKNGNLESVVTAEANLDMAGGNIIHTWVDYNGKNDKLEVFLSGSSKKPRNPLLSSKIDIEDTVGKKAYAGFSAATGLIPNQATNIDILEWNFSSSDEDTSQPAQGINGNNRNNRLTGTKKGDRIDGKGGNDTLIGAAGNDILVGGGGADDFLFGGNKPYRKKDLGIDKISDFRPNVDDIILDRDTFITLRSKAGEGFSLDREFDVVRNKRGVANSVADIVYDRSTGDLYYNANSALSGFGGGGKFATLEGAPNISESDFVLR